MSAPTMPTSAAPLSRIFPLVLAAGVVALGPVLPTEARAEGGKGEAPAVVGDAFAYVSYNGSSILSQLASSQRAVSVTERGPGVYRVLFPVSVVPRNQRNYAFPGAPNDGNVQVRAFGPTLGTCTADSWGPAAEGGTEVLVRCFARVGTGPRPNMPEPRSIGFSALFMAQGNQPGPTVPYAWILAPQSQSPSNAAPVHWRSRAWVAPWETSLDPLGNVLVGPPTARRSALLLATATGPLPRDCFWRWVYPNGTPRNAVSCAPLEGGSALQPFSVAVLDGTTLAPMRREGGYAAFDAAGMPDSGGAQDRSNAPNWSSNGQTVTARAVSTRQFQVRFARLAGAGGVAFAQRCQATSTRPEGLDQIVDVDCATGARPFSVVFVR